MAQQALPAGRATTRNRALFGLLDARGWGWASVKAVFWFILIIFMLGYIPDRAYYFVVNRTIDIGILAWSPINFCPPATRRCRARPRSGRRSRGRSRRERSICPSRASTGRSSQSGTRLLFIGGSDGAGSRPTRPTSRRCRVPATSTRGRDGPAAARGRAQTPAVAFSGGTHLRRPAATARMASRPTGLHPDGERRRPASSASGRPPRRPAWTSELPHPSPARCSLPPPTDCSSSAARRTARPRSRRSGSRPSTAPASSSRGSSRPTCTSAVMDHSAALIGDYVWVYGGTSPDGPTKTVQRGEFGTGQQADDPRPVRRRPAAARTCPSRGPTPPASRPAAPCTSSAAATGPRPRPRCTGPSRTPTATSSSGSTSAQSDLPESSGGLAAPPRSCCGPDAVLIGGETAQRLVCRRDPGEHRAAGAVLPARARRGDGAGAQDRRRDRPAAGLSRREQRRNRQLRDPAVHRLGVRPQGEGRPMRDWLRARREPAASRADRRVADLADDPSPGRLASVAPEGPLRSHGARPAVDVGDVRPAAPEQERGGRRGAAAACADDEDRPVLRQLRRGGPRTRTSGSRTAPFARTVRNSSVSRTSTRSGPSGSAASSRAEASATSIVGTASGRHGSSGGPPHGRRARRRARDAAQPGEAIVDPRRSGRRGRARRRRPRREHRPGAPATLEVPGDARAGCRARRGRTPPRA